MKIKRQTTKVLNLMAPKWMKKLNKAKWDVNKLTRTDQKQIRCDTAACFIGEIYCMTDDYTLREEDTYCRTCVGYCASVPQTIDDYHTAEDKQQLLDEIAVHMKRQHPDMIGKKFLGDD